jgi:hypothetical protein
LLVPSLGTGVQSVPSPSPLVVEVPPLLLLAEELDEELELLPEVELPEDELLLLVMQTLHSPRQRPASPSGHSTVHCAQG